MRHRGGKVGGGARGVTGVHVVQAEAEAQQRIVLARGEQGLEEVSIGLQAAITSIDPHYHNLSPNNSLLLHIYEPLVKRDANQKLVPGLATSWKALDDTTWEFKLRKNVFGLPVEAPTFPLDTWLGYMGRDKKNEGGRITLILLEELGRAAVVRDAPEKALRDLLAA